MIHSACILYTAEIIQNVCNVIRANIRASKRERVMIYTAFVTVDEK